MQRSDAVQDFRHALRLIRQRPGAALASVMILALGIGASTAIFSVVSAVLLKPLPYAEPDRLAVVWETNPEQGVSRSRVAPPTLLDWREAQQSFSALAGYSEGSMTLAGRDRPVELSSAAVTANFFSVLGAPVAFGRGFQPEDDLVGAPRAVILGYGTWRGRFGSDSSVIGDRITLDNERYTIIGVAAPGFEYPPGSELWTPLIPSIPDALGVRGARFLMVLGRLEPNVTLAQAEGELSAIAAAIPELDGWGARLESLQDHVTGEVRSALFILLAAVAFVLLIACANVANLLLARATGRRRELAIRSALGARRLRIASQLISETMVLAMAGGFLGVTVAVWTLDLLVAISPAELPRNDQIAIDVWVIGFALVVSALSGLAAGSLPALRFSRPDLGGALREGGYAVAGGAPANRLRKGLMVTEIAVSLVLLAGAGLLAKSFYTIVRIDPGFQPERVLTFDISLPDYRYPERSHRLAFTRQLLERMASIPGADIALTRNLPFSGRSISSPIMLEKREVSEAVRRTSVQSATVSRGYFRVMRIPLASGRAFNEDDGADGRPVAIVNEAFARRYFPGEDPVGQRATTLFGDREMREIVGVVKDVKHFSLTSEVPPTYYTPLAQDPTSFFTLVVRSEMPEAGLVAAARNAIWEIDPELPIRSVASLERLITRSVGEPRFYALVMGIFASLALILVTIGFYAVMSTAVAQRRREIGIRVAIGARRGEVVGMVIREGLQLTVLGSAIGLVGAFALTGTLSNLLYEVGTGDPAVILGGLAALFAVVTLASYVPARAASRVDPVRVLRD